MSHLLTRNGHKHVDRTELSSEVFFEHGRVHELCGPSRYEWANLICAQHQGPILWIRPSWTEYQISSGGIAAYINPARIVFLNLESPQDIQWACEEALRSSSAPVIIAEMHNLPDLKLVRRIHLAAETAKKPALFLLLSQKDGGAQGVQSRWQTHPKHDDHDKSQWALVRLRSRMLPPSEWRAHLHQTNMRPKLLSKSMSERVAKKLTI